MLLLVLIKYIKSGKPFKCLSSVLLICSTFTWFCYAIQVGSLILKPVKRCLVKFEIKAVSITFKCMVLLVIMAVHAKANFQLSQKAIEQYFDGHCAAKFSVYMYIEVASIF